MPHASLKLKPGLDVNETPALNEAGISSSNLIRFIIDRNGLGLVQKLGGWTKYYASQMASKVRALLAWADTNADAHLAIGMETIPSTSYAQLAVLTGGNLADITPAKASSNIAPVVSSTAGSPLILITDTTTSSVDIYDTVYIQTQISIGGVILFGLYPCVSVSATQYQVVAKDIFGNSINAATTSAVPTLPSFATTNNSSIVTVTLNNHGYQAGDTFPVLRSTTVGGITFFGNYIVQESGLTTNSFTIFADNTATSTTTGTLNGGNAHFAYSLGTGAPITAAGYGVGGYGAGGYGTGVAPTPTVGTKIDASDWTLDNWGEVLIACPVSTDIFRPIYTWNPVGGDVQATVIPTSPPINDGAFVAMPQRQIMAWGSSFTGIQDPLLLRWCDVNNYDVWVAQVTNQAGSFRVPRGSRIVCAMQGPQQTMVWTDLGLWTGQYIGPPYVYSWNEVGFGCGLIGRKAAAVINDVVFWMSGSQFFTLASNGVKPVPCPVWDVIFQNLDTDNLDKIRTAVNSRFNEITWFYPTTDNSEVDAYVKLNVSLMEWDYGTLSRSAWIDQSVAGKPIGADPNTLYLYQHETSNDADGQAMNSSFATGYFAMAEGDMKTFVDQVWPDMKWGTYAGPQSATVNITFNVTDYPGQTPRSYGPYPVTVNTEFITPRFRGRLVSISISSNDVGSFWRLGNIRYRLQPDGRF